VAGSLTKGFPNTTLLSDDKFNNVIVIDIANKNLKLSEALKFAYKHFINDFDWILKIDDNSYVVLENLRHLLYQYETDWPLLIGQRFLQEVRAFFS